MKATLQLHPDLANAPGWSVLKGERFLTQPQVDEMSPHLNTDAFVRLIAHLGSNAPNSAHTENVDDEDPA